MDIDIIDEIKKRIKDHPQNVDMGAKGFEPTFVVNANARVVIVGQAPGIRAQTSNKPWNDKSGEQLRRWLGVSSDDFYDPEKFAHVPMDFYFPGKGKSGDLPPRKGFADLWHPRLFEVMKKVEFTVLIGKYAQEYYLNNKKVTLTDTVKRYTEYLQDYIPLPHPSPRNNIWKKKNPWFEEVVIPILQERVRGVYKERSR